MLKYFYFRLIFILLIFSFIFPYHSKAQSGCPNSDFSFGDFTNWVGYTGTFTACCPTVGIVAGRHTIINAPGTDPRTGNLLSVLPPGSSVCAKLGNENVGAEAERLRYTLTVTPQSALFIYKYAVVMEDPGHAASDQPKFNISVLNSSGNLIDPVCGFYSVVSSGSIPGFQTAPGSVMWKNWTSVGINLTPYMGQNITVEYTTYDCAQGGHYGYAYLTAMCAPMEINVGFCLGNATVVMSAPAGFATYQWSPGGQTTQSITVTNPVIGTQYSCVMASVNGCQVTLNAVLQPTIVTANFNITSPQCSFNVIFQDSSSVNQGSVDAWAWDFGDGTTSTVQNPSHTYTTPGTYTVTLTASSLGCPGTTTQTVNVFPLPVAEAGPNQAICAGQSANLTASGGVSYSWSNNIHIANNNVSPTVATTYTVTVTDANGCTASDSVVVTVNPPPVANAGNDIEICSGTSTNLNATGGTGYSWSPANGLSNPNIANPVASPINSTTYVVTVTDANGCSNIDFVAVQILPLPPASAGNDQSICNTHSATLNASGGVSYVWSTTDTLPSITVSPSTTTNYTVTVTNSSGCSLTDDVTVNVSNPPPANAGNDTHICSGLSTILNASGGVSYAWSPPGGLSFTDIPNPVANPTTSTTYTVTVTDGNGCSATDDVVIGIFQSPSVAFISNLYAGCVPLGVNFTDNTTPAIQTWQWNFGDTTITNTSTLQNPSHVYTSPGTYTVVLSVTTTDGCPGTYTYTDMINVYPNPVADFMLSPVVGSIENPIIHFYDQSFLASTWSWNFGEGISGSANYSSLPSPMHNYMNDGTYIISLFVQTIHGCVDSTTKDVTIKPDFTFYIPNVFTPDGDGMNDFFQGFGTNIAEYEMYIFNRWGEQLYYTDDYNKPWNGRDVKTNDNYIQDVYVYKIIIKDINGKTHKYYGHITLLR